MLWKKTSWFWKSGFAIISFILVLGVSGCTVVPEEETEIQEDEIVPLDIEDDADEMEDICLDLYEKASRPGAGRPRPGRAVRGGNLAQCRPGAVHLGLLETARLVHRALQKIKRTFGYAVGAGALTRPPFLWTRMRRSAHKTRFNSSAAS